MPHFSDYKKAIALIVIPGVALIIFGTFLRLSVATINGSFFVVYLDEIGFTASIIALIYSMWSLSGMFSPLLVNVLSRKMREEWLLFAVLVIGILPIGIIPLFEGFLPLLAVCIVSGFGIGMTLPLLVSILSRSVSAKDQGLAVGLRTTANRVASFIVPLIFGLVVSGVGLHLSFTIIALLLIAPMVIFARKLIPSKKSN